MNGKNSLQTKINSIKQLFNTIFSNPGFENEKRILFEKLESSSSLSNLEIVESILKLSLIKIREDRKNYLSIIQKELHQAGINLQIKAP